MHYTNTTTIKEMIEWKIIKDLSQPVYNIKTGMRPCCVQEFIGISAKLYINLQQLSIHGTKNCVYMKFSSS